MGGGGGGSSSAGRCGRVGAAIVVRGLFLEVADVSRFQWHWCETLM
jgi:hypothetical protein